MAIQRMEHVGVVVEDLPTALAFFVELGLELDGETTVEGGWVDHVVGLDGVRADIAVLSTPDGHSRLELSRFHAPKPVAVERNAPANALGIRHLLFAVDDLTETVARMLDNGAELIGEVTRYENSYLLCYLRGPEGIIIELAEQL